MTVDPSPSALLNPAANGPGLTNDLPAGSAERLVATLVPGFVHEMNNALNAIVGMANLLTDVIEQTADLDCLRDIESAGQRATELLASMRRLADPGTAVRDWHPANAGVVASARIARMVLPRRSTVDVVANASSDLHVDAVALERLTGLMAAAWTVDGAGPRSLCLSVSDAPHGEVEVGMLEADGQRGPPPKLDGVAPMIRQLGAVLVPVDDPRQVRARLPGRRA